ncbi:HoxN/HupN/NixA family nickel/cobalt transporter [Cellulomonas cellasea]|uniref:Nickel/cobalt efflux system n=1 Tax=Cellulomonas cellasea TaxID=43670 RepID=A0A7W4YCQ0_9CELL|nr:HoxN/HupN/NixA family nickel/cobalt transporter [Cellulomonas cellasea]MBB2924354.1 high-affinity nickel-transport protein [Cellulomonas cellasea]
MTGTTTTTAAAPRATRPTWSWDDTRRVGRCLAVVAVLHVLGWGALLVVTRTPELVGPGGALSLGLGLTAYLLGVRHAFDADHVAVIDSTTRTLADQGRRPLTVGFWFSLGHSSVVVAMALVVVAGAHVAATLLDDGTAVRDGLATVGSGVAGVVLWVLGLVNLVALVGLVRVRRRHAAGTLTERELAGSVHPAGGVARLLVRFTRGIRHPAQVYPVGLLMGLGFDTASEVALLVLAATAAVTLPWYAVLALPLLFTAGMTLFDTLDGAFMNVAYGWALDRPLRALTYNLAITTLTVVIALGIGTAQLASVLRATLGLGDPVTGWFAGLVTEQVGAAAVVLFVLAWLGALAWAAARRRWERRTQD